MVLWDCVSLFDIEYEGRVKHEEISETTVTARSQGLLSKYNSILPKINKFQDNMKKIQKNNKDDKISKLTISSQDPKQVNMPIRPIEDKDDNVEENRKAPEMGYELLKTLEVLEEELPTNN